jgi:hypothetical protein
LLVDAGVDAASDRLIAQAQLLGRTRLELLVGAQEREKFGQAALEADLDLLRFHLLQDARDFGQAELMNLLGLERQRGAVFDQIVVQLGTARHC